MGPTRVQTREGGAVSRLHLTELDARVLQALPRELDPGRWLTPAAVAARLDIADAGVARSVLVRLRRRGFTIDDGERPQAFARTALAEAALERRPS